MNIVDDLKREFKQGSALNRIIFINIGVFVVIRLLSVIFDIFGSSGLGWGAPINWISMPSSVSDLVTHAWTPISYMFTHYAFLHLLMNMLWLYWFSKLFLQFYNDRQLIALYLSGGLAGASMYLLAYNLMPFFNDVSDRSILLGASGSVLAIVVAVASTAPNQDINLMFIGPVKLKYLAMIAVFVDLISITSSNAGGHLAHLGGALWGWMFVVLLKRRINGLAWIERLIEFVEGLWKPNPRKHMKVKWNRPASEQEFRNERKAKSDSLDHILDKIKQSGYESLSKDEKQQLFDASKN